jgi:hypothetical protein
MMPVFSTKRIFPATGGDRGYYRPSKDARKVSHAKSYGANFEKSASHVDCRHRRLLCLRHSFRFEKFKKMTTFPFKSATLCCLSFNLPYSTYHAGFKPQFIHSSWASQEAKEIATGQETSNGTQLFQLQKHSFNTK